MCLNFPKCVASSASQSTTCCKPTNSFATRIRRDQNAPPPARVGPYKGTGARHPQIHRSQGRPKWWACCNQRLPSETIDSGILCVSIMVISESRSVASGVVYRICSNDIFQVVITAGETLPSRRKSLASALLKGWDWFSSLSRKS